MTMTDLTAPDENLPSSRGGPPDGRIPRAVWLVVALGLGFGLLSWTTRTGEGTSALWWLDPLLLLGYAGGLWRLSRRQGDGRWLLDARRSAVVFIFLSWLTGMLYELSLRTGATGFGGLHPDTATSFIWAQGYYIPFAVGGWWLVRRYGYGLGAAFLTGALASLYEVATVGVPGLVAAPWLLPLAPLMLGYYLLVYAVFLTMPLLFIDPRGLWAAEPRRLSLWGVAWRGVVFGALCWVAYTGWAWAVVSGQ